jgi:tetratricopeptide (TPR) repeat protein
VKRRVLSVFVCVVAALTAAHSGDTQPVNTTQLMAWLIAGVSSNRLTRLVQQRGISAATAEELRQLQNAGADTDLIRTLSAMNRTFSDEPGNKLADKSFASNQPHEIRAELVQAAAEARQLHYHDAERDLRRALSADPGNAALHFALGAMLRQQQRWDDAFDEITQSARLMPDFPENHSSLAYVFYRLDDGPNAIAEARTALSMDPQNADAYQDLGLGLYSNGQYLAAAHAYAESLARSPENPDTYYDMGVTLHAAGNLPAAVAAYRQALRVSPELWQAHSNLALVLHEEGKLDEAIAEYGEAKRLAPEEASIRNNLGNTYCDKGDFDAAISEMGELYRQHPEWQQGHACLAQAYMSKKNYGGAVEELQAAVRQNPNGSAEHRVLGQALLLKGNSEEAIRELRLAVSLNPDSDVSHHSLGTALLQQQLSQAAEKEFREALRLNASADNHYSLAACLMTMDRYEEALSELENAARLDPQRALYRARHEELLKLIKGTASR